MTKADKISALAALLIMGMLAAERHHIRGNTLAFTLGFPLIMYGLSFWLSRARTAQWLEKNDQDEIISRRPMTERVLFGFATGFFIWLTYNVVPNLLSLFSDPAAWGAVSFILLILGLLVFCFLFGAGPRRLRLDVRRQEYSFQQGIPFLTWTKQGQISGGDFYVSRSKSGYYQVRFRAPRWKFGLPIASFETAEEACSQAWQIASKLGLLVKRRDTN